MDNPESVVPEAASPWHAWTAPKTMAASGMLLSFFLAESVTRAQLLAFGVGSPILSLAPIIAVGPVLAASLPESECTGGWRSLTPLATCGRRVAFMTQGTLMLATAGRIVFEQRTAAPTEQGLMVKMIIAALLVDICGFILRGGAWSIHRGTESQHG